MASTSSKRKHKILNLSDNWKIIKRYDRGETPTLICKSYGHSSMSMTPMEYVQKHIAITSGRRLLYNRIFNRHRKEVDEDDEEASLSVNERKISGQKIIPALGEVMGRPMSESEAQEFKYLVGWETEDWIDFRTWCGICALSERILGPQFCSQLPSRETDPCNGVEKADFDSLNRRLTSLNPDPRLVTILKAIREL